MPRTKDLTLLFSVRLLSAMGVTLILPVMPLMAKTFGLCLSEVGLVVVCFTLAEATMTPIAGVLSDRFGRRALLLPSLLVFALGGVLCLFADTWPQVLGCRILQGIGAGPLGVLYTILAADMVDKEHLPVIMGRLTAISSLGAILYPILGGLLGMISWRIPFLLFTLALPTALLSFAVPLAHPTIHWGKYIQQTGTILREKKALGLFFLFFLCYCSIYGPLNTCFPMLAEERFQSSPSSIGLVFSLVAAGSYLAAANLARLHQIWSFRTLMFAAGTAYTLPLLVLPVTPLLWLCTLPLFVAGIAQGLSLPIINDQVALLGTPEDRAAILAVSETAARIGQSLSPFLFSMVAVVWSWKGIYAAGAGLGLVILGVSLLVFRWHTATAD